MNWSNGIAYREEGSGKAIVFLHAFPLNLTMWDEQVAEFASTNRVVTFDWRGFGESELAGGISSMEDYADDLAGLLNRLSIDRAVICGLSMGGYTSFAFRRKYADRISAMILADTRATPDNEEGKQARHEMADLARKKGAAALVDKMLPRLLGETTQRDKPAVVERVKSMIESGQPEGIAQALLAMADRPDSTPLLSQIDCPALIIVGNEDKLTPPSESEKIKQAIPDSTLAVIDDAGHLPNIEQPASFNLALSRFLRRLKQ
jgi:3-oxoadipate enol-lactonase